MAKTLTAKQNEILTMIDNGTFGYRPNDMPSLRSLRTQGIIHKVGMTQECPEGYWARK